ncbi:MAG: IS110 family transposase [Methylococcales bacterium]
MTGLSLSNEIILGVDTHLDTHVGVIIDDRGKWQGVLSIPANVNGYHALWHWVQSFGHLRRAGIEGTGTYGAGLTHFLRSKAVEILEINRPDRSQRRFQGKSDPTDAENAARMVLSGKAQAIPKLQTGIAEAMRMVSVARRSAVKARTQTINQLRALLISAPDEIRTLLWQSNPEHCVKGCAELESLGDTVLLKTLAATLRLLAKRWLYLTEELKGLDAPLDSLTKQGAKRLIKQFGVGPQTAATLLTVAGDNPERLHSEAALAALCGANPLPASSGKTVRHRLNRSGDRSANNALWTIALVRMRSEPRTRAYVARKTAEGKSTKEIQRSLKRYIVRELYPLIQADLKEAACS